MTELLTAAQMRAVEAVAIASGAVTGLELMERAGAGVVAAVLEEWPEMALTSQRAVVLCGPGNNGGDGFVVARRLAALGWRVEVHLYGDAEKLPPDARVNFERWQAVGEVRKLSAQNWGQEAFPGQCDLVFDALFGIGLTRPIDLPLLTLCPSPELRNSYRIVAVDVPSGLCADGGRTVGPEVVVADLTVTFHRRKLGHMLADGVACCGHVRVVDIGLQTILAHVRAGPTGSEPDWVMGVAEQHARSGSKRGLVVEARAPFGIEKRSGHKFSHGHALIVSGDHGRAGAARLAARGALRIGAGLVTVASPSGAMAENAARLDAVMLRCVADAAGLAEVLGDARINALCLGPGMGLDARAAGLVRIALETTRLPVQPGAAQGLRLVLDADALTLIARDAGLFALLHESCVVTPHVGEFARLFPDIAAKLTVPAVTGPAYSKVDACREAAARAGCVVLFKGADTVIAQPDGRCSINAAVDDRSAPWLATAGSGDVLAGFITGLLARGLAPMQAAETAAWLHVECAREFGPGLIAEDLADQLPVVFRRLGVR